LALDVLCGDEGHSFSRRADLHGYGRLGPRGSAHFRPVLAPAKAKAAAEHKAIFVHFGASWCGWCRHLDALLERPDLKPVFEKCFVPVMLVVQETEPNKALENPGADALLRQLGGPSGLPYSAFLDAQGHLIINSKRQGENIG
jgi:thiol-disulfide isomerase/thioredoxin